MPLWDWHRPLKLRRRDQESRTKLLLAVAELDVFTAALRAEINRGGDEHDPRRPAGGPPRDR
jgi:uncharacterized small protein (DUF1192 family)